MHIALAEIDSLSITLLMDNYTDRLLPLLYPAIRNPMVKNERFLPPPVAEHGFSALVRAVCYGKSEEGNKSKTCTESITLFDCGISENGVVHNADILGINLNSINSVILSHGHFDHFTGLLNILKRIDKPVRMICHPNAFLRRWIIFPNDKDKAKMPFLDKDELKRHGVIITEKKTPSIVSEDNIEENQCLLNRAKNTSAPKLLITGEIPRNTPIRKRVFSAVQRRSS